MEANSRIRNPTDLQAKEYGKPNQGKRIRINLQKSQRNKPTRVKYINKNFVSLKAYLLHTP